MSKFDELSHEDDKCGFYPAVRLEEFYCHECGIFTNCFHIEEKLQQNVDFKNLNDVIYQKLTTHGFVLFTGLELVHSSLIRGGSSSDLRLSVLNQAIKEFFSNPLEDKLLAVSKDKARRGYSPLLSDNFASLIGEKGKPNDTVEKYRIGPLALEEGDQSQVDQEYFQTKEGRIQFFPNIWSGVSSCFKCQSISYYHFMVALSKIILSIYEFCLKLPRGYLQNEIEYHTSILAYNFYANVDSQDGPRIADHTDVSMFTIVADLTDSGLEESREKNCELQVLDPSCDTWVALNLLPHVVAANVGDYLSDRSHGLLKSARHRVMPSNDTRSSSERITSAFFFTPNYDAKMTWPSSSDEEVPTYSVWRKKTIAKAIAKMKEKS